VSNAAKIAVLLLLAAAGTAWFYLQPSSVVAPVTPVGGPQDTEPAKPEAGNEAAPVVQATAPTPQEPQQRESAPVGTSHADAEQGVRGRVPRRTPSSAGRPSRCASSTGTTPAT